MDPSVSVIILAYRVTEYVAASALPGDYLRIADYRLMPEGHSIESRIQFASFFAYRDAKIARGVDIGCDCVPGMTHTGERAICADCRIGSGSVVVGDIPADSIAAGNPARVIGDNQRRLT
jgi:acetyltransferase-like isoleucine patch superfamily enzyme